MPDKMHKHEDNISANDQNQKHNKPQDLPAPAVRALKEAEMRRTKLEMEKADRVREIGGRGGEDPARYGDWEVKGIATDF